jgi:hypothetical protein
MRSTPLLLALSLAVMAPSVGVAQAKPAAGEEGKVRAVVERYLRGLKFNDVNDFRAAFWPDATLMFNLLRIGTEWRIVNKIYTSHAR